MKHWGWGVDGNKLESDQTAKQRALLPGVLRRSLIEEGRAKEAELRAGDLQEGLIIGNSLRGLVHAKLVSA